MDNVTLRSKEGNFLVVSTQAAKFSKTVKTMLEVMEFVDTEPIPVMEVDFEILRMVFEWINQKIKADTNKNINIEEFEKNFFPSDMQIVYHIIQAANYLDIEELLKRSCTEVAMRIAGKTSAQMRDILGIPTESSEIKRINVVDKKTNAEGEGCEDTNLKLEETIAIAEGLKEGVATKTFPEKE